MTFCLSLSLALQDERHQQKEQHLLTVQEERPRQAEAGRDRGQAAEEPGQRHVLLNPLTGRGRDLGPGFSTQTATQQQTHTIGHLLT